MEPLSARVRRFYFIAFILLFFSILPIVILYADGWRYKQSYGFVRTGGIFISVPYPEADVYVNGEQIGRSGFLERSFYVPNLAPSAYIVHVEREGFQPWDRLLVVEEQLVTDSRALLIPNEIEVTRIAATSTATTTRIISTSIFNSYRTAFATTTAASSTLPVDESGDIGLFIDSGKLLVRWVATNAYPPSQFCERPSVCAEEITLEDKSAVTSAHFFRGGVVYRTRDGQIRFTEIDIRETPVEMLLYSARGADMRVVDDSLLAKEGDAYYEISL